MTTTRLADLKVLAYELEYDEEALQSTTLEQVRGNGITRWAIRQEFTSLGKTEVNDMFLFHAEPSSPYRDDAFFQEYRWITATGALFFWNENRPRIVAMASEQRAWYAQVNRGTG